MFQDKDGLSHSQRLVKISFLDQLIALQQETGLSDRAFARELGVQRVLWQKTRSRQCAVGLKILAATVWRFPQMRESALEFMKELAKASACTHTKAMSHQKPVAATPFDLSTR